MPRSLRISVLALPAVLAFACGDSSSGAAGGAGRADGGGVASDGASGSPDGGTTTQPDGSTLPPPLSGDLCEGLVQDKAAHTMTALAKPAVGQTVTDAEFGTTIRRITAVAAGAGDAVIKPMYTTIPTWNADESRMILYHVSGADAGHHLYDGKTYQHLRALDIRPADLEQVWWHTTDPDLLYYTDGKDFIRYHVSSGTKDKLTTFSFCTSSVSNGDDPMFTSWDSNRVGLRCDSTMFVYDVASNSVVAQKTYNGSGTPPGQVSPSGTLAFLEEAPGVVLDVATGYPTARSLDLVDPANHSSLGRLANGHDTWNGTVYDPGPKGNADIGALVTWDLTTATSTVVIGPKTGYPYPPTAHVSAMAYRRPGWVVVSTLPNGAPPASPGLLDLELLVADTNTGKVCRVGRHRTWGKSNTHLSQSYWAEAHAVPSPTGTRIAFASDWGNGTTVDTYVVELPSYGK